jgi:hypothetical protein
MKTGNEAISSGRKWTGYWTSEFNDEDFRVIPMHFAEGVLIAEKRIRVEDWYHERTNPGLREKWKTDGRKAFPHMRDLQAAVPADSDSGSAHDLQHLPELPAECATVAERISSLALREGKIQGEGCAKS